MKYQMTPLNRLATLSLLLASYFVAGANAKAAAPSAGALQTQPSIVVSVTESGAKGDGIADDTVAIEKAVQAAAAKNGILFFPRGEYLISRGIYLQSNLTITGAQGAILKKNPAVTQKFTKPVNAGDTVVYVEDASAFRVDQDFYMWDGEKSGFTGTVGKIVAIDTKENKITFEAYKSEGAARAYAATDKSVFSSTFSMLTTNSTRTAAENLVIEGMTFDCQRQPDEPDSYPLAPIHIDPQRPENNQRDIIIRNNIVLNSASDGISVQAGEDVTIENNQVYDCAVQGIHVGFTIAKVTIRNNVVERCGGSGVFWCYGVTEMIVTNNFFRDGNIGCGGIDHPDSNSVIAFNTFNGMGTGINVINGGNRSIITGNIFLNGKGTDINVYCSRFCIISDNMFSNGKQIGISLRGADRISVTNNQFNDYTGEYCIKLWRQPGGPQRISELNRISGNMLVGGKQASLFIEDSRRITVSENQCFPAEGGVPIQIADTCSDILLRDNIVEGDILNASTKAP